MFVDEQIINGVNLMGEIVPGYTDVRSDLTFDSDATKYQVNIGMEYQFLERLYKCSGGT